MFNVYIFTTALEDRQCNGRKNSARDKGYLQTTWDLLIHLTRYTKYNYVIIITQSSLCVKNNDCVQTAQTALCP